MDPAARFHCATASNPNPRGCHMAKARTADPGKGNQSTTRQKSHIPDLASPQTATALPPARKTHLTAFQIPPSTVFQPRLRADWPSHHEKKKTEKKTKVDPAKATAPIARKRPRAPGQSSNVHRPRPSGEPGRRSTKQAWNFLDCHMVADLETYWHKS